MPANVGVVVVDELPFVGAVIVTVGGVVSTVHVTAGLVPVFAGVVLSDCVACAVYVPSASAAASNVQVPPPLTLGVSVWMGEPVAVPPL